MICMFCKSDAAVLRSDGLVLCDECEDTYPEAASRDAAHDERAQSFHDLYRHEAP
jgi:hypothetical protein